MGDPKKTKKHYETPKKPHDSARLEAERAIVKNYGLKNKRELRRAETILRKKRENGRQLLALPLEERLKREKELLQSLARLGLLSGNTTLDDVLTLSVESLLERRLQTMVLRKGLANTAIQSRQFIVHGHIMVAGGKVTSPSYLVKVDEEKDITYYGKKMQLKPKEKVQAESVKKEFEKANVGKEADAKNVKKASEGAKGNKVEKQAAKKEQGEKKGKAAEVKEKPAGEVKTKETGKEDKVHEEKAPKPGAEKKEDGEKQTGKVKKDDK